MSGTTPNIGLNVPDHGDKNWDVPVNQNWNTLDTAIAGKQATLVSGTNIKTINNNSILGSGNVNIDALPSQTGQSGKFLTTDGTDASWANVPTRNIGEIVESTIPLTDAGLHLLDGAVINGSGAYSAFVTYIAGLVPDYPDLFTTEADWQSSVTTYGVCGKFVYDSINNTVRLPKRSNVHGNLIKTYLSDTDWYRIYADGWCEQGGMVSVPKNGVSVTLLKTMANTNYSILIGGGGTSAGQDGNNIYWYSKTTTSISLSNKQYGTDNQTRDGYWCVCGYTDISDLQQNPVYEYIVIANSTKTNIEVDIDEIATDLNGKADVDLSNVNASGTSLASGWSMPSSRYINLTLGATGSTYTAPANGWFLLYAQGSSSDVWAQLVNTSKEDFVARYSNNAPLDFGIYLPVNKGDVIMLQYSSVALSKSYAKFRFYYAEGEN